MKPRYILIAALLMLAAAPHADAAPHIGLKYWYLQLADPDLRDAFDDPVMHSALIEGDFEITRAFYIRFAAGYGQFTKKLDLGLGGPGHKYEYSQIPIELGARLNIALYEHFHPYVAAGPGVYLIQIKNTEGSTDDKTDEVGIGAWIHLGADIPFNENVGWNVEFSYVFAEAKFSDLDQTWQTGGPGLRTGVILLF